MTITADDALAASLAGLDDMAGADRGRPVRRCKLGRILDDASPANRAGLHDLLDGDAAGSLIALVLRRAGQPVSESLINAHRAGRCGICTTQPEGQTA